LKDPSRETLKELLELARIDFSIDRLSNRLRRLPEQAELDALLAGLGELEGTVAEQEALLDAVIARQRKLEVEIDGVERKIKGEETRLYSGELASPRELSSVVAEVESLKRRRARFEDDDLEVMQEREDLEKQIQRLSDEIAQVEAAVAETTRKRDEAAGEVGSELEILKGRREGWLTRFDEELLAVYDGLRSSKSGVGAAALQGDTCLGCRIQLPAQEVMRLRRSTGLVRCVECGRILVVV
jgi:uncharacterized protein